MNQKKRVYANRSKSRDKNKSKTNKKENEVNNDAIQNRKLVKGKYEKEKRKDKVEETKEVSM